MSAEDRHPIRSPYVSSKAGNQSFDRSNVWRSMLNSKPTRHVQTSSPRYEVTHKPQYSTSYYTGEPQPFLRGQRRATKSFGLASEPPCFWNQVLNEASIMTENPNPGNSNPYLPGAVLRIRNLLIVAFARNGTVIP